MDSNIHSTDPKLIVIYQLAMATVRSSAASGSRFSLDTRDGGGCLFVPSRRGSQFLQRAIRSVRRARTSNREESNLTAVIESNQLLREMGDLVRSLEDYKREMQAVENHNRTTTIIALISLILLFLSFCAIAGLVIVLLQKQNCP